MGATGGSKNDLILTTRSPKYAAYVELASQGWMKSVDIAATIGCSLRSVYRYTNLARRSGLKVRSHNGSGGGVQIMTSSSLWPAGSNTEGD